MHQLANKVGRVSRKSQRLERLEAEYQKNNQQIRQLHHRNHELASQMRRLRQSSTVVTPIGNQPSSPLLADNIAPMSRSRKPKSLRRLAKDTLGRVQNLRWGKYSLEFWLQAVILSLGVALVCGSLSFMVTRLVAMLLGG